MEQNYNDDSIIMSPGDVSSLLGIKESTLRKYALILKDAGYHFYVNEKGQRWYYNKDVIAFRKLTEIKQSPDMTLEQAANAVVAWFEQSNMSLSITDKTEEKSRYSDDIKAMKETIEQQNMLLQELVKKMDSQQRYIDQRLEERDKIFMQSIREAQEEKKALLEVAAAREEENKKKGFFARLFGL